MKRIWSIFLLSFLGIFQAQAEVRQEIQNIENTQPADTQKQLNDLGSRLLRKHIQIMNGWYVNDICNFMSSQIKEEWQKNNMRNEASLRQEFHIDEANFVQIEKTLKPVLAKTECAPPGREENMRDMVAAAFADAQSLRKKFDEFEAKKVKYAPSHTHNN